MKKIFIITILIGQNMISNAQKNLLEHINRLDSIVEYNPLNISRTFPNRGLTIFRSDSVLLNGKLIYSKERIPNRYTHDFIEVFGKKFLIFTYGGKEISVMSDFSLYERTVISIINIECPYEIFYLNLGRKRIVHKSETLKLFKGDMIAFMISEINIANKSISLLDNNGKKIVIPFQISFSL
ncbi:MAG: hypothetical protein KA319_00505 [Ferruginibacter sp.]|nr:hypothetical protein [Ferruginibacter sp.]